MSALPEATATCVARARYALNSGSDTSLIASVPVMASGAMDTVPFQRSLAPVAVWADSA